MILKTGLGMNQWSWHSNQIIQINIGHASTWDLTQRKINRGLKIAYVMSFFSLIIQWNQAAWYPPLLSAYFLWIGSFRQLVSRNRLKWFSDSLCHPVIPFYVPISFYFYVIIIVIIRIFFKIYIYKRSTLKLFNPRFDVLIKYDWSQPTLIKLPH